MKYNTKIRILQSICIAALILLYISIAGMEVVSTYELRASEVTFYTTDSKIVKQIIVADKDIETVTKGWNDVYVTVEPYGVIIPNKYYE